MKEVLETVWRVVVDSNVLKLFSALLILLCGWLVAILVSKGVSKGLRKIGVGRSLAICLPEEDAEKAERVERFISGLVFYLILILTVLGCLGALNLTETATPISGFITVVTAYFANILAAAVLAFIAWVCATALRYIAVSAMTALHLDETISKHLDDGGRETHLSNTLSTAIYWMTFIFFAPAILSALGIKGITAPIEGMLAQILNYLPHIFAGVGIAMIGLFLAGIARKVVTNLLNAANLDRFGEKAGVYHVFGQKSISSLSGYVVYALIAIPVVIAALTALKIESLSQSVSGLFDKILNASGNIFGAAVLIFVCYIAGSFMAGIVAKLLEGFGFDRLMETLGVSTKVDEGGTRLSPSAFVGKLTMIAIMFMALIGACEVLELNALAGLIRSFIPFAGNIIVGVIVFLIGIFLANLASDAVRNKEMESHLFSLLVKVVVLVFAGALALHKMGIGSEIVLVAFTMILGSVAVAAAIAFGIGGREWAAKKLQAWSEKLEKKD